MPDLAETVARLTRIEETLPAIDIFHFGGFWIEPGVEMARAIGQSAGNPDTKLRSAPWFFLRFAAQFLQELLEIRYLWRVPIRLDDSKLVSLIGEEPRRPLEVALKEVLREPALSQKR